MKIDNWIFWLGIVFLIIGLIVVPYGYSHSTDWVFLTIFFVWGILLIYIGWMIDSNIMINSDGTIYKPIKLEGSG